MLSLIHMPSRQMSDKKEILKFNTSQCAAYCTRHSREKHCIKCDEPIEMAFKIKRTQHIFDFWSAFLFSVLFHFQVAFGVVRFLIVDVFVAISLVHVHVINKISNNFIINYQSLKIYSVQIECIAFPYHLPPKVTI